MSLPAPPERIRYDFGGTVREARVVDAVPFKKYPEPMELVYRTADGHLVLESDATPI